MHLFVVRMGLYAVQTTGLANLFPLIPSFG